MFSQFLTASVYEFTKIAKINKLIFAKKSFTLAINCEKLSFDINFIRIFD